MKHIWCNTFPEIYAQLEDGGGVKLPWTYVHCAIYIYHRHETGFVKETRSFGISIIFSLFGMDTGRCVDEPWQFFHACALVFPPC